MAPWGQMCVNPGLTEPFKFVCLCSDVRKSIDVLSLRFDVDHMRFLYESEGMAEY